MNDLLIDELVAGRLFAVLIFGDMAHDFSRAQGRRGVGREGMGEREQRKEDRPHLETNTKSATQEIQKVLGIGVAVRTRSSLFRRADEWICATVS